MWLIMRLLDLLKGRETDMIMLAHVAGFTCLIIAIFGSFGAITTYNINRVESVCVSAACSVIALAAIYLLAL